MYCLDGESKDISYAARLDSHYRLSETRWSLVEDHQGGRRLKNHSAVDGILGIFQRDTSKNRSKKLL